MYKILVVSDTHKIVGNLIDLMTRINDVDHIVHLGDVAEDAEIAQTLCGDIPVDYVRGNCDPFSQKAPKTAVVEIQGKRFLLTHGDVYDVKISLVRLKQAAKEQEVDVALFGHTHIPHCEWEEDILFLNPGSMTIPKKSKHPTYALIQIDDEGRIHTALQEYIHV